MAHGEVKHQDQYYIDKEHKFAPNWTEKLYDPALVYDLCNTIMSLDVNEDSTVLKQVRIQLKRQRAYESLSLEEKQKIMKEQQQSKARYLKYKAKKAKSMSA